MARLKDYYKSDVAPALMKKFGYKSVMQIPKLEKIVVNVACGEARENAKVMDAVVKDLSAITGQKPVLTTAKKSIANFKLREGMVIGAKVTLRGDKMYEFMDRFFNVALPRVRDFRGINANSFDGRGNYNIGLKEQLIFPEIEYDKIDKIRGMDISFITTAKTDEESRELLSLIGAKVTLRGEKMYEFMDRFFNVALPRVRDFRGINANSFDGRGNYNIGLKEQLIFPEIEYDKIDKIRGMDISFITTAKTDEEARELLSLLGAPFEK